jgi:hypothetical protein
MTPPLSISAKPIFKRKLVPEELLFPFNSDISLDLDRVLDPGFKVPRAAI